MASHLRSRSPDGSFHGMPVACTFVPGAWPMISSRAVVETRSTGLGPNGKEAAQTVQARAWRAITSSDDTSITQVLDHLSGQLFG
jgi:hypothetical protein